MGYKCAIDTQHNRDKKQSYINYVETDIFVALVVHWTRGKKIGGT